MRVKEFMDKVVYNHLPTVAGYAMVVGFVAFCITFLVFAIKTMLTVLGVIG